MPLTAAQKVTLQEITRETLADVSSAADDLTTEQETVIAADIVTWNLKRNSVATKLTGKVDYNTERLLARIFYRVREMLGFDFESYDLDSSDSFELVELETGVNFG